MKAEVPGYELLELIGSGAYGQVYLAREVEGLGRRVALKVFYADPRGYARELEMVRKVEALRARERAGALVQSLGAGEREGLAWIAFEYLEAGTLEERVAAHGPLFFGEAVECARQAAEALALLHENGIFHRDVKPANLLLGSDGRVRVADFGLSRSLDGTLSAAGSPAFAAPELIAGRPTDGRRLDVYSLGATLAYLLTAETMLPGRPDVFLLERHGVPRPLQRTVVQAMATDADERFATMQALLLALVGEESAAPLAEDPPPEAEVGGCRREAWKLVERTGYAAAAATSLPLPGSEWIAVLPLHVAMVVSLGKLYGHPLEGQSAKALVGRIGSAVGLSALGSRVAMTAAKLLLPGVGGFVGAPFMYASTLALGGVAISYFERGGDLEEQAMRRIYRGQFKRARRGFDPGQAEEVRDERAQVTLAEETTLELRLRQVQALREAGLIDAAEYRSAKARLLQDL